MKLINIEDNHSWVPGGHAGSLSREVVTKSHGATQVSVHSTTVAPGGSSDMERHPDSEQIFVVLAGEIEYTDGQGVELVAGPGTAIFVPIDHPHASANRTSKDVVLMVITAPPTG